VEITTQPMTTEFLNARDAMIIRNFLNEVSRVCEETCLYRIANDSHRSVDDKKASGGCG
jgi:hypothetical protein